MNSKINQLKGLNLYIYYRSRIYYKIYCNINRWHGFKSLIIQINIWWIFQFELNRFLYINATNISRFCCSYYIRLLIEKSFWVSTLLDFCQKCSSILLAVCKYNVLQSSCINFTLCRFRQIEFKNPNKQWFQNDQNSYIE